MFNLSWCHLKNHDRLHMVLDKGTWFLVGYFEFTTDSTLLADYIVTQEAEIHFQSTPGRADMEFIMFLKPSNCLLHAKYFNKIKQSNTVADTLQPRIKNKQNQELYIACEFFWEVFLLCMSSICFSLLSH